MRFSSWHLAFPLFLFVGRASCQNDDRFNYRDTKGTDFGPKDWNKVSCNNPDICLGWPDSWEMSVGWKLDQHGNLCEWCPEGSNSCGQHRQSPIDLSRDRGIPDHRNSKECIDWHWMKYEEGSCSWNDLVDNNDSELRNNFVIARHALQIKTPVKNGNLKCTGSRYPRIDYSKGFPRWWFLAQTSIKVKSEHMQEKMQYDAEVHLEHFYEEKHDARKLGTVAIFLQVYNGVERWDFLDKLICQWREVEDKVREDCRLPSVPNPYPGCRNPQRGLTPAPTEAANPQSSIITGSGSITAPSIPIIVSPTPPPTARPTSRPEPASTEVVTGMSSTPSPPPPIRCDDKSYASIRFQRMCKKDGCCESKRSSTGDCQFAYEVLNEKVDSACHYCCDSPKKAGPPPPENKSLKKPNCAKVDRPNRICSSCCTNPRSDSNYCRKVYKDYPGEEIDQVCWYCCGSDALQVGDRRNLRLGGDDGFVDRDLARDESSSNLPQAIENETASFYDYKLEPSNFEQNPDFTVDDFNAMIEAFIGEESKASSPDKSHRELNHLVNYDHVPYFSYQWMLKVKTEYYFRYEGGQTVPPCFERVHWRVLKDPIPIHKDQLAELERLIAWRIAPKGSKFNECARDTAGKDRPGSNGNAVDVNRPVQQFHNLHRKVFCECKDWPSKFPDDKAWCNIQDIDRRFFRHPYNFYSGGHY